MKKLRFKRDSLLKKIIIVALLVFVVYNVFKIAILFRKDDNRDLVVCIHNEVGVSLAHKPIIEDNIVYLSEEDIKKYFDDELYYEDEAGVKRFISVVQARVVDIKEGESVIHINGEERPIKGKLKNVDGVYYFPITDFAGVYNIDVEYLSDVNRLNIDRLSREKIVGVANYKLNVRQEKKFFSKVIAKVDRGSTVTIVDSSDKNWYKIKTSDYAWGYVKKNKIINVNSQRKSLGSMDFSGFNVENAKILDINNDSYSVWSDAIETYSLRQQRIKDIVAKAERLIADNPGSEIGVRVTLTRLKSFDNYYKFLKELKAYLNDSGICLIVTNENLDTFLEKEQKVKSVSDILE